MNGGLTESGLPGDVSEESSLVEELVDDFGRARCASQILQTGRGACADGTTEAMRTQPDAHRPETIRLTSHTARSEIQAVNIFSNLFAKPETTPASRMRPPQIPRRELLAALGDVELELEAHAEAMRTFRTRNFEVIDGVPMTRGVDVNEAVAARAHWNQLLRSLTILQQRRSLILRKWSDLKKG